MALTSSTNRLDYQPKTNKLFARYKYLMLAATFIVCALLQARLSDKVFFPMRFAFLDEAVHNASILSSNVTQPGRRSEFRDGNTQTAVTGKVSESERGNGLVGDKQTSESNNAFQNLSHKVDLPASGNVNQSVIFDKAASKPNVVTDLVVRHEKVPGSNISQSGNFSDQRNSKEGVLGAGISETNIPGNLSTNQSVVLADNISRATPLFITITHQMGRMGNNMFEYASLLGIARAQGRHPFVNPYGRDHNLPHVFNLTHVEFIPECGKWKRIGELKYGTFDPVFRDLPKVNLTLMGYVQSWKYFRGIEDEIRREFTFMPHIRIMMDGEFGKIKKYTSNTKRKHDRGRYRRRAVMNRTLQRNSQLSGQWADGASVSGQTVRRSVEDGSPVKGRRLSGQGADDFSGQEHAALRWTKTEMALRRLGVVTR